MAAELPGDQSQSTVPLFWPADADDVTVAISSPAAAATAAIFSSGSQGFVRLLADQDCHIAWGSSPTATTSRMKLVASQVEHLPLSAGDKIQVIKAASATQDGTLRITKGRRA